MKLSDLHAPYGARKSHKRLGRGHGSGRMKTSGRGQKGQKARTGHGSIPAYFEGGQNRFSQRMPYLGGFKNPFKKVYTVVNLRDLISLYQANEEVNAKTLVAKGFIRPSDQKQMVKVLGEGKLDRALKVTANKVSESARKQIEEAGGTVTLIAPPERKQTKRSGRPSEYEAKKK
ncbi:MAG TPA: 50S ribosomal protein L15 [Ktedonobacterales bacterium]|nr:50S ribosomal protein L15 [Ktedonobacterales bacterium]